MAPTVRGSVRPPAPRLEHAASENCFASAAVREKPNTTGRTVLGDITNASAGAQGSQAKGVPQATKAGVISGLAVAAQSAQTSGSQPAKAQTIRPPLPTPRVQAWKHEPSASQAWAGDDADSENVQCVTEYVEDIYANLRGEEAEAQPTRIDYMEDQPEINARMRAILVDWLVEVHMKYKLKAETLFLTVRLLDMFLSRRRVTRKRLQLVGVAATLVSSKFEEIYPPEIRDLVYICDRAYTKDDIITMEVEMLTCLEFNLRAPTAVHFLDRFAKFNGCNEVHRQLAQYLAELALPELRMLRYTPSHVAAAAILLSNKLLKRHPSWPQHVADGTGYTEAAIRNCAKELCALLEAVPTSPLQAVKKKFSYARYHSVANMTF